MGISSRDFEENLAGIRLAVFEILWPSVRSLNRVLVALEPPLLDVYFQFDRAPSAEERGDCEYLMQEVLDAAFQGNEIACSFSFGSSAPAKAYPHEVMSKPMFEKIAAETAPWRLEAGR